MKPRPRGDPSVIAADILITKPQRGDPIGTWVAPLGF